MTSRLVNVRLDEPRLAKARRLRAEGIPLSQLVREAIDQRYEQVLKSFRARDAGAIMRGIYRQHPDPADLPPREYDVHDRGEAKRAVLRKLQSRH